MELGEAVELILSRARALAGVEAEVVAAEGHHLEAGVRLGRTEKLKRSRERRVALRLIVSGSSAVVSTADLTPDPLTALVDECAALARATAPDPLAGLPDLAAEPALAARLDLYDPVAEHVGADEAIGLAQAAETAALETDSRLENSEGGEFSCGSRRLVYATATGFRGEYRTSSFSLSVVPVARAGGGMQRDYWYTAARHRSALESAASVGKTAAARTLRRLGARTVRTRHVPVVFDPETAGSLLGHLAAAVSGSSVYR
ncbi:MAG: TldD/PmbA family protein, partial [Candidatus Binatia bacterium]